MELKYIFYTLFLGCVSAYLDRVVPNHKKVFDQNMYDEALDADLCSQQLSYMTNNNSLLMYRCKYLLKLYNVEGILTFCSEGSSQRRT